MKYKHLTYQERYKIRCLKSMGYKIKKIAQGWVDILQRFIESSKEIGMNEVTIPPTKPTITQNRAVRTTDSEPVVLLNHYELRLDVDLSSSGVQSKSLTKQG